MFQAIDIFFIEARTGCGCCAYENHYRGPYASWDAASDRVDAFKTRRLTASSASTEGIYLIKQIPAERLADGRYIAEKHVFDLLFHVNEDGSLEGYADEDDKISSCHFIC